MLGVQGLGLWALVEGSGVRARSTRVNSLTQALLFSNTSAGAKVPKQNQKQKHNLHGRVHIIVYYSVL